MSDKILILGGTKEAVQLAGQLVNEGHDVTTSLAGRTKEPNPVNGKVRTGGFGGASGLAEFLNANGFDRLIDATHPFATRISANAQQAAALTGIRFEQITRPPWQKQSADNWIEVTTIEAARDTLPKHARVLLALGSQHIEPFSSRNDVFFLVRMVDHPPSPLPLPKHELLLSKPSSDWREEMKLLQDNEISHVISRNSGGTGAYAKIEAARVLGVPVIMIQRSEVS